jgi:hypothetical protein
MHKQSQNKAKIKDEFRRCKRRQVIILPSVIILFIDKDTSDSEDFGRH